MTGPLAWLAAALAALAITAQPIAPPASFERGMERRGTPVVSPELVGMTWPCQRHRPWSGETCYAGLSSGRLVTGP